MKKAVVTGAAGFAGCNLTEHLIEHGYEVYAVIRRNSAHNDRLKESERLHFVTLDMTEISELPYRIGGKCDAQPPLPIAIWYNKCKQARKTSHKKGDVACKK